MLVVLKRHDKSTCVNDVSPWGYMQTTLIFWLGRRWDSLHFKLIRKRFHLHSMGYTVWFMRKWGKQIESSFKNSSLLIFKTKFYFVSKFPNHFLFQKQLKIIKNVIRKQSIVSTIIHNSIFSIGSNWTFLSLFLGNQTQ